MDIDSLIADERRGEEGAWFDYRDGARLKVASARNRHFVALYTSLLRAHRRRLQQGEPDPALEEEILCRAMARHVLLDWQGLTRGGAPLAYDEETAFALLRASLVLREDVAAFAEDEAAFRRAAEAAAKKNSAPGSASA